MERLERFERLISFNLLGIRCLQRRLQSKFIGHRLLDDGALEEVRVVARVQTRGVGERELAEIVLGHEALLDQLKGFRNHVREIGHIEMGKVGAENRRAAGRPCADRRRTSSPGRRPRSRSRSCRRRLPGHRPLQFIPAASKSSTTCSGRLSSSRLHSGRNTSRLFMIAAALALSF